MATTRTWDSTSADSWRDGGHGWRNDGLVYQGQWSGWGHHKGLWFFNDANIRSHLADQRILNIRIRATRRSSGGNTGGSIPTFRRHNHASRPGGEPSLLSPWTDHGVSFAWGETKWLTLPLSWGRLLRDNEVKGIGLWTTSNSPYMIFTGSARLEITYEPILDPPATPTGLTQSDPRTYSIRLSWNPVALADDYTYERREATSGDADGSHTTSATTVTNSAGIEANRSYAHRIRANNDAGFSNFSNWVREVATLPLPPTGLTVVPSSGTAGETVLQVSHNAAVGTQTTHYLVERENGPTVEYPGNSIIITGLSPDTTYRFRVRTVNSSGLSAWSSWVTAKTNLPAPARPSRPSVSNIDHSSALLSGSAVSYAESYDIELNGSVVLTSVTSVSWPLTDLAEGTDYSARVRAKNATGTSDWSLARTFTTERLYDDPVTPTDIKVNGEDMNVAFDPTVGTSSPTITAVIPLHPDGLRQRLQWEITDQVQGRVFYTQTGFSDPGSTSTFSLADHADRLVSQGPVSVVVRSEDEEGGISPWSPTLGFYFSRLHQWTGSAWVPRRLYRWTGSAWVFSPLRVRVGGDWK